MIPSKPACACLRACTSALRYPAHASFPLPQAARTDPVYLFAALALHQTSNARGRALAAARLLSWLRSAAAPLTLGALIWLGDLQALPQDTDSEDELPVAPAVAVEVAPPALQARAEGGRVRA